MPSLDTDGLNQKGWVAAKRRSVPCTHPPVARPACSDLRDLRPFRAASLSLDSGVRTPGRLVWTSAICEAMHSHRAIGIQKHKMGRSG